MAKRIVPYRNLAYPLGLYFVLVFLYLMVIPPGESPDEPGHLQCIEQVSNQKKLPEFGFAPPGEWWSREVVTSDRMCYHMPLYYVAGGLIQAAVNSTIGGTLDFQYPPTNPDGPNPSMFNHAGSGLLPGLSEPATSTAVRVFTILLGAVTIFLTYRLALNLFPSQSLIALSAAILVAGWPQFLFMSRAISNDILTAALSLAVLTILVGGGGPRRYIWAVLLTVLAILTKTTAFYVGAALVGSFIVELWSNRRSWTDYMRAGLVMLAALTGLALLLALQPTISENLERSYYSFTTVSEGVATIGYWFDVLTLSLRSGAAHLGWMNLSFPGLFVYGWWIFVLVGLVVGIVVSLRRLEEPDWRLKIVVVGIWMLGLFLTYMRINISRFQPQIRFILVLIPITAVFTSYGYLSLLSSHQNMIKRLIILLGFLLLLINIGLLFLIIQPAYFMEI